MRDEILIAGQELAQSMGVAEFSYADLSERVGIRSASIHHHFAKKEDLVTEIASRYRGNFGAQLRELEERPSSVEQLEGYRDLFEETVTKGDLCLCGSAAAEWSAIGDSTKDEVKAFFAEQTRWLTDVISKGMASGEFSSGLNPSEEANLLLAALEGATLLARVENHGAHVGRVFDRILTFLTTQPSK